MKNLSTDDITNYALKEFSDMVYKLALSQTKNKLDAEDIFQDVFLRMMKSNTQFESKEHMKAWLIRTTLNCCKSLWNSAWFKKTVAIDESLSFSEKYNEENLYIKVMELPKKYRTVIHLFYYEDMSIDDIAKTLHIKKQTIASQLSRARSMLKQKIGGKYDYE